MRDILFKAKRKDNGECVEGSYAYTFNEDKNCPVVGIMKENHWIVEKDGNLVLIDKDTICQYTGLTDKNGNKIWENDVVRYKDDLVNMVKEDLVKWNETHASFTRLHKSQMGLQYLYISEHVASSCEVIGNVVDNPELIGE